MKSYFDRFAFSLKYSLILLVLFSCFMACNKRSGKPRILVFSKTAGYHHSSIANGNAAIMKLGQENGFDVDTTTNANMFTEDTLKKYAAVVFLSSTGDLLNNYQEADFERYIQAGGGYMGIHAAADAEYDWGWYGRLVGAYFESHPQQQEAVLHVVDTNNIATKGLPKEWKRKDEWYNFKNISKDIHVLITIDENSYQGGKNGSYHPMAWYHDFDGGRAFYTELGHTEESYSDPLYLKHILGGIKYAMGENKELDYGKAKTLRVPEENRFVKTTLTQGTLFEPTEMAILPNLDVLIAQRRGELMMYNNKTGAVKQVGLLNVFWKATVPNVNAEEGFLGITADPDYKNNHYIYIFYSPIDTSVNRLSRFEFKNDTLDLKSEKVILQFYSQRNICCHTGGSLAFGNDNVLFLSAGDNSTPFDEPNQKYVNHGYAPLNDLPGHLQYDARRSAGNTNDLRGKIMRIHIKPDGTYDIPQGNLFVNNPKARPEIYVMGDRNPYRISIDKKTGFLYWGEVGPDAPADSMDTRGPKGYDEVNQARKAGNFGWPLFIGNNIPYRQYDYATGKSGQAFDPQHPINDSRNNTGLQELPPAQSAFIWYPYDASKEFPQVGAGGRTAMAGPVYHTEDFPKDTRFPDYYNNKLFIYDWIRGWIKVVTMQPNGDFDKMEPFMEHTKFNAPIDMETGPDGRIYVLEYGSGWFSKNADAGLARIDYLAGNRPPKVGEVAVDKTSGKLPFTVNAKVEATDPENDVLKYVWTIGTTKVETKDPQLHYTINQPGDYAVSVQVSDDKNATSKSNVVNIYAGNERPEVAITINGNQSFYFLGKPVAYKVNVNDNGDSINWNNLFVSVNYAGQGEQQATPVEEAGTPEIAGKSLFESLDCKTCHKVDEKSIGPAFIQVAQKYHNNPEGPSHLVEKIIKGGSGVWGEVAMPAHSTLPESDVRQIVQWILSMGDKQAKVKSLPAQGTVMPAPQKNQQQNVLVIQASYTDNGGNGIKPLSAARRVYLRNSKMNAGNFSQVDGFTEKDSAGARYLVYPSADGWIKISQVDLSGITSIELDNAGTATGSYQVTAKVDNINGSVIGQGQLNANITKFSLTLQAPSDGKMHDLYIQFHAVTAPGDKKLLLKTLSLVSAPAIARK